MQVLRFATLLKRDSNTGDFSCELFELSKNTYFVEDLWTADSQTPLLLFKSTFFTEHLHTAASDSIRFPACNSIKKKTQERCLIVHFPKFSKIFWQNTSGWLLLICEIWEVFLITSFIEHLWETAYSFTSCRISTTTYSKTLLHKCFSSIL